MTGKVTYNGHGLNEFVPQRTSAYVNQQDWHAAEMTVRETLDFSARCQGVGFKHGNFNEIMLVYMQKLAAESLNPVTDMLLELSRREKSGGIIPDEDLDIFIKAWECLFCYLLMISK